MNTPQWSDHLRALAASALAGTPLDPSADPTPDETDAFIATFRDELGHRRAVDRPILAHLLGTDPGPAPANATLDARLWHAIHAHEPVAGLLAPAPGPLLGEHAFAVGAIETTTETELAALHALAHHAERRDPQAPSLTDRMLDASRWHVQTLQPDNGTNHPWAVHVFIMLAEQETDANSAHEATLHAETLVHNSIVNLGRPDRFSACLLLDAARVLDERPH